MAEERNSLFAGRIALVTGGSRGIGRAICVMLAEQGAAVAVNYAQNEEAARETLGQVEAAGARGLTVQADVSREEEVARMAAAAESGLGPVDLLVNNAGMADNAPHGEVGFPDWKRMFEVNVDGPFLTTWAVKDGMIARGYGRIVNISSLAAMILKKNMIPYATTKADVVAFTRHCSEALAPHNIRVNCLAPGLTDTEMGRSANPDMVEQLIAATPLGRMASPEEMAAAVKFLLSEDSSFITGQTIVACGGRV
ncbi:MAG: SDR family NAD(P)-dependent oxidoreductase [Gemmatimonadetes bacterium]|nr:SDR family NAD(P)-dependent oxidoreductase [Gemmatimonadota bacterium]